MILYVSKCHHVGPENQEEMDFSLVDRKRRTFLAIQVLLPQFVYGAVVHCSPGRCPSKGLRLSGTIPRGFLKRRTMDCDCQAHIPTVVCDSE